MGTPPRQEILPNGPSEVPPERPSGAVEPVSTPEQLQQKMKEEIDAKLEAFRRKVMNQ